MASTITADNGVSSGSAGIKTSADSTGVLALQTTTAGGAVTTAVTVDNAQNVGVGVTPSAWSSPFKAIEGGDSDSQSALSFQTNANAINLHSNSYYNGGYKYKFNGTAGQYTVEGNTHYWSSAATGTAGNAISFTQAMTLSSDGFLGIGISSPVSPLHVKVPGNYCSIIADTSTSTGGGNFVARQNGSQKAIFGVSGSIEGNTSTDAGIFTETGGAIKFYVNGSGTPSARIDSSGNLLVGLTSSSRRLAVDGSNTITSYFHNSHNTSGDYAMIMALGGSNTNNVSSYYLMCDTDNVGIRMVVYGNGNIQNINNSYGAYSDIKLKENITDATPKLADLMQVRIRNYNLIGEDTKQIGVVAQELEQVFPGMVEEAPDYEKVTTTDEDGNEKTEHVETGTTTKSIKYSVFVPMLIKAMQEQQALITTLTERITALEAK